MLIHWYWKWIKIDAFIHQLPVGYLPKKGTSIYWQPNYASNLNYWTQIVHNKTTRELGKSRECPGASEPVLLPKKFWLCRSSLLWAWGVPLKEPLSHSGAQSVSRWFLWNSTGYGPSKYVPKSHFRLPGNGRRGWTPDRETSLNVYHTSSLAARLLLSTFSASAVGIIRQIRQYVRRYVRNQTRVK